MRKIWFLASIYFVNRFGSKIVEWNYLKNDKKINHRTDSDKSVKTPTDFMRHLVRLNTELRISNCLRFFYTNKTHHQQYWQHINQADVLDFEWRLHIIKNIWIISAQHWNFDTKLRWICLSTTQKYYNPKKFHFQPEFCVENEQNSLKYWDFTVTLVL